MKKYRADKKSLSLLRVISFILLIALIIVLRIVLNIARTRYPEYFAVEESTLTEIIIWSLMILFIALYILFLLIYLPLWYSATEYGVSGSELSVKTGVFNTSVRYMKLSDVQYVTVLSTLFSAYTSFNFIVLSVHGGKMTFMFLSRAACDEIADFIRNDIAARVDGLPEKAEKPDETGDKA